MPHQTLTISRLAASAEVNVETVRYYQRRGLLNEPARPLRGIRRYNQADVARLQFIRRAQSLGFSLHEIAELLALNGQQACEQTREITELKLADVRHRLRQLQQLEHQLARLVADCKQVIDSACCPTLNLLEKRFENSLDHPFQPELQS